MSSVVIEFPGAPAASSRVRAQGGVVDPARPAPRGGVRLTRRGRVVVVVAGLLIAFLAGVVLGSVSEAADKAGEDVASRIVVVDEGDTLWGIAAEIADDGEVRSVMREIERMNALDTAVVQLGQRLRVPAEV
ncbi:LysM peptidoglycan-binding domain-containing protein [Nocardioides yefusunii]|uniref:LysM peptidoglycan-binding domain-containing protein n=1 Tax=Nocardioides yefusunii TaxID=2500546 RepID=A0ABW1R017_9ACTN|nr:LysM peptidoglycan-binding domain-containing protein [Nocardioides yefusunii]